MKLTLTIAALAMMTATGALADTKPVDPEKKVCRSEKVTGSLTRVNRICMTQAEWDQVAFNARKRISDMGTTASVGQGTGNQNGASSGVN